MRTIYVAIGNSDDKLSQARWASFVQDVECDILSAAQRVFVSAPSPSDKPWQNACWIFEVASVDTETELGEALSYLAAAYDQESIAWAVLGEVAFIRP